MTKRMSPSLREDLAKLDKDPDTRRTAMDALKGYVEQMDMKTMPQFLDQVSETRESEASRHYAISLYVEVVRVHKHEVVPFIPRIMSTVVRSLPSSGGSQQLQHACAKVVTSVARYTIDPTQSPASNEEILHALSAPLLAVLCNKLEPLAVGAAICLQALVESEKWKFAPPDLLNYMCSKGTAALSEKGTQTVAHLQLMRSLAKFNGSVLQGYAAQLIRAGVDILQAAAGTSGSWQQRVVAALLLSSVLKIADGETLGLDLTPAVEALERCRHDKAPGVRTAVVEALHTAKSLDLDKDLRQNSSFEESAVDGGRLLDLKRRGRRRSSSRTDESGSQEFQVLSDNASPNSCTPSRSTVCNSTPSTANSGIWQKRSPLFPAKQSPAKPSSGSRGSTGSDLGNIFARFRSSESKENAPARKNKGVPSELLSSNKFLDDLEGLASGRTLKELSPLHRDDNSFKSSGEESSVLSGPRLSKDSFSECEKEDKEPLALGVAETDTRDNSRRGLGDQSCTLMTGRYGLEDDNIGKGFQNHIDNSGCLCSGDFVSRNRGDMKNGIWNVMGQGNGIGSGEEHLKNEKLHGEPSDNEDESRGISKSSRSAEDGLCNGCTDLLLTPDTNHYSSLAQTMNSETGISPQRAKAQMTAEDFLLFTTPRRLVRSLQSGGSTPKSKETPEENRTECMDMDIETTLSETGWSVRDNPISGDSEGDHPDENLMAHMASQRNTVTSSSSCCSLEGLTSGDGKDAEVTIESEERAGLCGKRVDSKCLSVRLGDSKIQAEAGSCQLSFTKDSKDSTFTNRGEKIAEMQVISTYDRINQENEGTKISGRQAKDHSNLLTELDTDARCVKCVGERSCSVVVKGLNKAQSCAEKFSGGIVCVFLILFIAIAVVKYLSSPQEIHVLVPT